MDRHEIVYNLLSKYEPFGKVLDIGCSRGDFLIPIRKSSKSAHGIDVVDFTPAWRILEKKWDIHCQKFDFNEDDLPFSTNSLDLVTCVMALEHLFDLYHAVPEMARVLSPGGFMLIQVPNIACIKRRLGLLFGQLPCTSTSEINENKKSWDGQHLHYFTFASLAKLLSTYDMHVIETVCCGKLPILRNLYPSLLAADITVLARKSCD